MIFLKESGILAYSQYTLCKELPGLVTEADS